MSSVVRLGLLLACILLKTECSDIFPAQCRAECLSEYQSGSAKFQQCLAPCLEDYDELMKKTCYKYCTSKGSTPCHFSCKFIKGLYSKGYVPGKCPYFAKAKGRNECDRYQSCGGLQKCCYHADFNRCWDITIPGEEVKAFVSNVNETSLSLQWEISNITNVVYIVQMRVLHSTTIYYTEDDWGEWQTEWQGTEVVSLKVTMIEAGMRLQFRVAVVNSSGLQGIGPPTPLIRTLFTVTPPSSPEAMWTVDKSFGAKREVNITVEWFRPNILDVPVHGYKLYWKEIPQDTSERVVVTKERTRVPGAQLNYTITGLTSNKLYYVEIQAICLYNQKRLKSPKIGLNVSTSRPKGVTDEKITVITNLSNFSVKRFNNSSIYRDREIKEIEVIVASEEGESTPRTPHGKASDSRSSGGGGKTTTSLQIVVYLFVLHVLLSRDK